LHTIGLAFFFKEENIFSPNSVLAFFFKEENICSLFGSSAIAKKTKSVIDVLSWPQKIDI
jgi:hypothetical protein